MAASSGSVVVDIRGLTKRLGRGVVAVDHLDLVVEAGQVLGLAGPNGSGKSVTLKAILGLVRPTSGEITLFGEPVHAGAAALGRVGALVDGPGFVPHLSGLENLRLACRLRGHDQAAAGLEDAIELAGLGEALDRAYSTYSHGMRYRLGLAQALLGRPDLLILDEPTTGLDPVHIREVRRAIATQVAAGTTVIMASHMLDEVEHVCTHTAIMKNGRLVAAGRVDDLTDRAGAYRIDVRGDARAAAVLRTVPGVSEVTVDGDMVAVDGPDLLPGVLLGALADADVDVAGWQRGRTLEEVYLALLPESPR
jgi:ABC-2 type transport system ATP-binding protein